MLRILKSENEPFSELYARKCIIYYSALYSSFQAAKSTNEKCKFEQTPNINKPATAVIGRAHICLYGG